MTVAELIEELQKYPGDWEVIGEDFNYWYVTYGLKKRFKHGEPVVSIDIDRRFYE